MSSNANHNNTMVITRDNYEEYLLMYVDDELSAQERSLVEAFLQFHPELQGELDLLMGTKLQPEALSFGDTDSLLADKIRLNSIDESLLLYVDHELEGAEKEQVEQRLKQDEDTRRQYGLLMRTKSDPAEIVPYPNKEELYRHTVHLMRFAYAWRIAAAVLLLASLGLVFWMQQEKETSMPVVANNPAVQQSPVAGKVPGVQHSPAPEAQPQTQDKIIVLQEEAPQLAQTAGVKASGKTTVTAQAPVSNKEKAAQVVANNQPEQIAYQQVPAPQRNETEAVVTASTPAKKVFDQGVTSQPVQTYTTTEAPAAEPSFAVNTENEGRGKGNLKALLRRATRVVERRTRINATNEDDELLIGALAIKLK